MQQNVEQRGAHKHATALLGVAPQQQVLNCAHTPALSVCASTTELPDYKHSAAPCWLPTGSEIRFWVLMLAGSTL